ncbi:DUF305 domain-containing protein [Rhodohalobacter sp. 614A]|uniref:DUF305 domain-containing protein n=1 Tax=Rhodohalobacter sp. 614A TaxID=2908649 RepID=UPI001F3B6583|nr:DUF305 domain-containing protein [Rhodohalobacter sp. 614A]
MDQIVGVSKSIFELYLSKHTFTLLFCSIVFSIVSCTSTGQLSESASTSHTSFKPEKTETEERLEEVYWAKVESAKMNFTQADVDFMVGMIAHHSQALIMSDLAPKNEAGSMVQTLAARIINAQKDEIASMQRWLRERNQPVPKVHIDGLTLTITMESPEGQSSGHEHMEHSHSAHAGPDHSGMPGMLTQDQLNELAGLNGDAFDQAFLTYMISHHEGGVTMVKELFNTDGAALDHQAFRLASDIQVDQTTEIERMELMLQNMKGS